MPLFRNGIAKVGTFSEPANFSRTFFHFFFMSRPSCIILHPSLSLTCTIENYFSGGSLYAAEGRKELR